MDRITRTNGLSHIAEAIFMNLDHKNLEKCMQVNPFWAKILSNPQFWLKKCLQKEVRGKKISRVNGPEWIELIQTLKSKKLKKTATTFLIEIYKRHWSFAACHGSPINMSYRYNTWKFFGHILKTLSQSERTKALIERIKYAIEVCDYKKLKALLLFTKDTNLNDLNAPEFAEKNPKEKFFGWTPIQKAAHRNHPEIVEILIPFTVDPNAPSPEEWTPLQIAAQNGFSEIVKLLVPHASSPNAATPHRISKKFNLGYSGWTPLQTAVQEAGTNLENYTEVVKILAPLVDNTNVQNPYGWTSLQEAASKGYTEIVKVLAPLADNLNVKDPDGYTLLERATELGNAEIVTLVNEIFNDEIAAPPFNKKRKILA